MGARETLMESLAINSREAEAWSSPFYSVLCARMRDDVADGGPSWELLEPYAEEPTDEYYPFRALAGVHHMVLSGGAPELEARYPSVGGDGDADAAWPHVRDALAVHSPDVLADLRHPLQTNETSRCGALIGGFLTVAAETGLPVRARELGASAGLNLHFDRYRYEQGGAAFGPADSPVRFVDHWLEGVPPLGTPMEVSSRLGCDLAPLDPTTDEGRLSLLSFIFPDQTRRYELLREAIEVARELPVEVDTESVDVWAERELAEPAEGEATVVFHSLVWLYLPEEIRNRVRSTIEAAAERASASAPLAWLSYELAPDLTECELRLRSWPGEGADRLLATGDVHLAPVTWLAPPP